MTEVEPVLDFASSGRSGRRNALPDILGSPAGVNPGDLPLKLAELNLKGEVAAGRLLISPVCTTPDPPVRLRDDLLFSCLVLCRWSGRGPVSLGGGSSGATGELRGERGLVGTRLVASKGTCRHELRD